MLTQHTTLRTLRPRYCVTHAVPALNADAGALDTFAALDHTGALADLDQNTNSNHGTAENEVQPRPRRAAPLAPHRPRAQARQVDAARRAGRRHGANVNTKTKRKTRMHPPPPRLRIPGADVGLDVDADAGHAYDDFNTTADDDALPDVDNFGTFGTPHGHQHPYQHPYQHQQPSTDSRTRNNIKPKGVRTRAPLPPSMRARARVLSAPGLGPYDNDGGGGAAPASTNTDVHEHDHGYRDTFGARPDPP